MNNGVGLLVAIAVIVVVVGLRVWRMSKEQRYGIVGMWVLPAIFAALTAWMMIFDKLTSPSDLMLAIVALVVGGAVGWYQGTHTTVRVDRAARAMFVKTSPIGIGIFMAILLLRVGARSVVGGPAPGTAPAPGAISVVSVLLLVLLVGMIAGLRAYLARLYAATT